MSKDSRAAALEVSRFKMCLIVSRESFRLRNIVGGSRIVEEIAQDVVDTVDTSKLLGAAGTVLIRSIRRRRGRSTLVVIGFCNLAHGNALETAMIVSVDRLACAAVLTASPVV